MEQSTAEPEKGKDVRSDRIGGEWNCEIITFSLFTFQLCWGMTDKNCIREVLMYIHIYIVKVIAIIRPINIPITSQR